MNISPDILDPTMQSRPNYLLEYLMSETTLVSGAVALGLGGLAGTITGEFGWVLIPGVLWASGVSIGAMIVPGIATWRHKVNLKHRRKVLKRVRQTLLNNINENSHNRDRDEADMLERFWEIDREIQRVRDLSGKPNSRISAENYLDMEEAAANFLRLFYAWDLLRDRIGRGSGKERLISDIRKIAAVLEDNTLALNRRQQLEKSLQDLSASLESRRGLPQKEQALRAQLVALEATILDLCHEAVGAVSSDSFSSSLRERLNQLSVERDLHAATEAEMRVEKWQNSKRSSNTASKALELVDSIESEEREEKKRLAQQARTVSSVSQYNSRRRDR